MGLTPLTQLRASQHSSKLLELLRAATDKNLDTISSRSHSRSGRDPGPLVEQGTECSSWNPELHRISNGIGFEVARRWALSQASTGVHTLSPTIHPKLLLLLQYL